MSSVTISNHQLNLCEYKIGIKFWKRLYFPAAIDVE